MDNPEEDLNGLQLWFLNELVSFRSSFLLFVTFGVMLWER